jgi:hypothetical protein
MSTLNTKIILGLGLLIAAGAGADTVATEAGHAVTANRIVILERAADNRELAGATQMAHARALASQAFELQNNGVAEEGKTERDLYMKIGELEKTAAKLCGIASTNYDMAAANQQRVVGLNTRLGRTEKERNAQDKAAGLKQLADQAIEFAGAACERAAVAFDRANEAVEVAAASQQAALWLEKLATR